MINASQIQQWVESAPGTDLAQLESGAGLRARFVSFLALRHSDILQRYLSQEQDGSYAVELLMLDALVEVTRTRLRGVLPEGEQWSLLHEWITQDEDAYELVNSLRPE